MTFAVYDLSNGQILRSVTCPDSQKQYQYDPATNGIIEGELGDLSHYVQNGVAVKIPDSPGKAFHFNYLNKQWEDRRTLAEVKVAKNSRINASRLQATQSHFMFQGRKIATDPLSRSDIDATHGAILMLQALPPGWPGAWKTLDNDYVAIPDEATWGQFYGAMVAQGTANFNHSQALKAQLAAASTLAEVEAVADW
jgi:hypothetical protein